MKIQVNSYNTSFKADDKKQQNRSRSKCNKGSFIFSAALVDLFVTPLITKKVDMINPLNKKPFHKLTQDGIIGLSFLAVGWFLGLVFDAYDKKHPTKLGDFFFKLMNGPNAKE